MENSVDYRVRLKDFRDSEGKSSGDFADSLKIDRSAYSKIEQQKRGLTIDNLMDLSSMYNMSIDWLLTGEGKMRTKEIETPQDSREISTQKRDLISIPMTSIQAAAGVGHVNEEHIEYDEVIDLPTRLVKRGDQTYLCIRVKGHSMAPTLQDGGYIVIRLLQKSEWIDMREEHIYVVVTVDGTFIKRIKNRFPRGFIVLMSDNPDKASYPNLTVPEDEVLHVWYAEWYLSAKMPNIHNQYYSRLQALEDRFDDLEEDLKMITTRKI